MKINKNMKKGLLVAMLMSIAAPAMAFYFNPFTAFNAMRQENLKKAKHQENIERFRQELGNPVMKSTKTLERKALAASLCGIFSCFLCMHLMDRQTYNYSHRTTTMLVAAAQVAAGTAAISYCKYDDINNQLNTRKKLQEKAKAPGVKSFTVEGFPSMLPSMQPLSKDELEQMSIVD